MVHLLLEKGANPNVKDNDQWTPLHVAALKRHNGLVRLLLDRVDGARTILSWMALQLQDPKKQALLEEATENKAEASTVLTGLRAAIQEKQLGRSKVLLDKGADVNAKEIGGGWTALIIAATNGYKQHAQLLLENGADVNLSGHDQRTALHCASGSGYEAVVQLLVENGADVNASAHGWTAGLLAAKERHMSIVQFLIEKKADVNAGDCHGRTALHWAAMYGSQAILQLLADEGANLNAADRFGGTAFTWAVESMQQAAVQMLLQLGVDIHAKARHSMTVLHIAAFIGSESIVRQLVERGADIKAEARWAVVEDDEYESVVSDTVHESLSDLLRQDVLIQETVFRSRKEARHGLTAEQLAASRGHVGVQQLLRQL